MEFQSYDIALVPIIVILVEVIKRFGLPGRFLPIANIILGQLAAFIYVSPGDAKQAVLVGLVMAFLLWACGPVQRIHSENKCTPLGLTAGRGFFIYKQMFSYYYDNTLSVGD